MRVVLLLAIALHGIIHLFGFLKAFGLSEFNAISQPISKPFGIFWLSAFMLLTISVILLWIKSYYGWMILIFGVIVSQTLIIIYWSDAKFGTLLNIIILVSVLLLYSSSRFEKKVRNETIRIFKNSNTTVQKALNETLISNLPPIVQLWLTNNNTIGKEMVYNVYLKQELQMLMKPEEKEWKKASAHQYFTVDPPAFIWSVALKVNPWLKVVGKDKFENGRGEMIIKLLSFLSMAHVNNESHINQATLQRYMAEMVWFPSAVLSPYITWEFLDEFSARATMEYGGTKGSGVFHFDRQGHFKKFMAMRYKDANDKEPTPWTVTAVKTEEWNGVKIPVELTADWKVADSTWTWLKLKISDIRYNVQKMPLTNQ